MRGDIEARLQAAYQAKAAQVPDELTARPDELVPATTSTTPSDGAPVTSLDAPSGQLTRRNYRRWAPLAVAAAVVLLVAGGALTRLDRSGQQIAKQPPTQQLALPRHTLPSYNASTSSSEPTANKGPMPAPAATSKSELPPPMLAAGVQGDRSKVPWSEVGEGWTLAQWSRSDRYSDNGMQNPIRDRAESIFLVDPLGGRYLISDFPVGDQWTVTDWSPDGRTALLRGGGSDVWGEVAFLDLHTGQLRQLTVPGGSTAESLLGGQDGHSALISTNAGFQQLSVSGQVQLTFPSAVAGLADLLYADYSPDRTLVAFSADHGMALFTAEAEFVRELATPGTAGACYPLRWSSDEQIVARCDSGVWLFSTSGARPTRLTPDPAGPAGRIYDALPVGTVVLYPVGKDCGSFDLAYSDGQPGSQVSDLHLDPAVVGRGVRFVAAQASTVQLLSMAGCGHAGTLTSRDIDTHTNTTLLGGQVNGGGVIAAVGYHDSAG